MKKLILLFAFLFACFAQAQNIELLKKANKCDLITARSISDEIVTNAKNKYVYFASKESSYLKTITFIYIKADATDVEKKAVEALLFQYTGRYELQLENCLCVHFIINEIGKNKDLEIAGTKEYSFDSVKGKYLDLFPFYQKNIEPTATTEKTTTTGTYSVRKDKEGYWYNFIKTNIDGSWYLKNMSNRLN